MGKIRAFQLSYPEEKAETYERIAHVMVWTFDPFPVENPSTPPPKVAGFPPASRDAEPREQLSEFKGATKRGASRAGYSKTQAHRRVALVHGNAAYLNAPQLRNAVNDANDIAEVIEQIGFQVITDVDRTKRQTEELLQSFIDRLDRAMWHYSIIRGTDSRSIARIISYLSTPRSRKSAM
jgi:hypothetical protein